MNAKSIASILPRAACLIWGNTGTTQAAVRPLGGISKRHTTLPVMRFIVCIALAIAAQLLLVRRYSEFGGAWAHDDLSQELGPLWPAGMAFTYSSTALVIIGRTLSLIGWIEGTVVFHFVPSHWASEIPPCPLWSAQLSWIGAANPGRPISFQRPAVMLSASKPRRTSSPITCFLPVNFGRRVSPQRSTPR